MANGYRIDGQMLGRDVIRFLIVGALNTIIGYFLGVGLYYILKGHIHTALIGILVFNNGFVFQSTSICFWQ